jgi:hypothetical protein
MSKEVDWEDSLFSCNARHQRFHTMNLTMYTLMEAILISEGFSKE